MQVGAVNANHIECIMVSYEVRHKGYEAAVWAPRRPVIAHHLRNAALVGTIGVHDVDVRVAAPVGGESNETAVGTPGGIVVGSVIAGQATQVGAVRIHHVDLSPSRVVVPCRGESNEIAVGAPCGMRIRGAIVGQPPGISAVGIHDVDLVVPVSRRCKCDRTAVWTPSRGGVTGIVRCQAPQV